MTDLTTPKAGTPMPRRRVLQAAGIGGAAMVAAACGARPPRTASSGATEEVPARTQPDQSATDAKLNWSTVSPGDSVTTISARSPGDSWIRSSGTGAVSRPPSVPTRSNRRSSESPNR